jgi:hypothetical protein
MLRDMPLLWRFRKRPWVQDSSTVSSSVSTSLVLISCLDTVKNHGVNEDVVKDTFVQAEAFFATSSDVKKSVGAETNRRFRADGSCTTGRHLQLRQLSRLDGGFDGEQ